MSIAAGVFIAFEPVHQMTEFATAVQTLYGGASPMVLVNAGIVGVGLRGAMS